MIHPVHLLAAASLLLSAGASAQDSSSVYRELQRQEARVATVAYRINRGAQDFCWPRSDYGWALADVRQYPAGARDAVRRALDLPPDALVFVTAVVDAGAAQRAGVQVGDALTISGWSAGQMVADAGTRALLDQVEDQISQSTDITVSLTTRSSPERQVRLVAGYSCAIPVQVSASDGRWAVTNGRIVSIPAGAAQRMSDDLLAAVVAHEMAHVLLGHRAQAEADASAQDNARRRQRNDRARARELEADAQALQLLRRAGYPPAALITYLRAQEDRVLFPGMAYRRHPSWRGRREQAERILANQP